MSDWQAEGVVHAGREAVFHAGHEAAHAESPAVSDDEERRVGGGRFRAFVAIVIALTTLIAAVAGYLEATSSIQAEDLRLGAEQLSLQALASSQSAQQTAQVQLETFERWVEERTQAANAMLASLYADANSPEQQQLELEQQRWETTATATLARTDIDPTGEYGPEQDPTFPDRYFAAASEESLRLNALADAADGQASGTDQQAASYTAVLAILAVSLYLFGLTLAVAGRWLRTGFLAVGLSMLLAGSTWMVQTVASAPTAPNDLAATEYAQGEVAFMTAFDSQGFTAAEQHFDRAIQLRPDFARAYAERADAIFQAATPQQTGFVSLAPPAALQRARTDLETAVALGLANSQTLGGLGFYGFAQGVQANDVALLDQSADYTRRAIALDPGEPVFRYNLAVTLVAAGRFDEARSAYQDAVASTIYVDTALTQRRDEPTIEEAWLAGALTDLDTVAQYQPQMSDQIRGFKEQIEGEVAAEQTAPPVSSPASFSDVQLDVFPAEVQWQGTVANYDATRDVISAQWYHQDPAVPGWAVIPDISYTVTPRTGSDGRLFVLEAYLGQVTPAACLPVGNYRAEIYINGRMAAQSEVTPDFGASEAFASRDLTIGFCRPPDWVRREDRLPGLIDGYQSPDGSMGVYAARYGLPGSLRSMSDISAQIEDLTISAFAGWFPATPAYSTADGTASSYFAGLSNPAWRWYDYGSGAVRIGAGLTADGAVVVGMVYGPYDWFNGAEPYRILDSMVHVE